MFKFVKNFNITLGITFKEQQGMRIPGSVWYKLKDEK